MVGPFLLEAPTCYYHFLFSLILHTLPSSLKLVELSKAQDVEAGDGTTTVVIIAGSLLSACHKLLEKGWHTA